MDSSSCAPPELQLASFRKDCIRKTMEDLESKANSALVLTLQWEDLDRYFTKIQESIESRNTQVESLEKTVNMLRDSVDERLRQVEDKERRLEEKREEFQSKVAEYDENMRNIVLREARVEERELIVEASFKKLESQEQRFCEEVALETKKLEERKKLVEDKEKQLEEKSKASFNKLGSQEQRFCKQVASETKSSIERKKLVEDKKKQLEGKSKQIEHKRKKLEAKEKQFEVESKKSKIIESLEDGKELLEFLTKHCDDHDVLEDLACVELELSNDPAKLVLDAMKGFYIYPKEEEENVEFVVKRRRRCILLLDQLMEVSPTITLEMMKKAKKLADDWLVKIEPLVEDTVLGFLMLLSAYRLANSFESNKVLYYFQIVARHHLAPKIGRSIGLADKIYNTTFELNLAPDLHKKTGLPEFSPRTKENQSMSLADEDTEIEENIVTSKGLSRKRKRLFLEDDVEENNITSNGLFRRRLILPNEDEDAEIEENNNKLSSKSKDHKDGRKTSEKKSNENVPKNILVVEDAEFNDFDISKKVKSFAANQIWAMYDPVDGMPRFYALIKEVFSSPGFKVKITWLEADPDDKAEKDWCTKKLPVACGKYITGVTENTRNLKMFSHQMMNVKQIGKISYFVRPGKRETWAVFKDWSLKSALVTDQVEYVEIQSCFAENIGVEVVYLRKLDGFVSLFEHTKRRVIVRRDEFYKFSHRVPSLRMTGTEKEGVPHGSLELDPASLLLNYSDRNSK